MSQLLVGTTLLVSFLGGVVALLAPCCVSVMLPAYLATGFRHRARLLAATLVFGAGVATVILPIGLGAAALSRLFVAQHLTVYLIGGTLMLLGGVAVLAGWSPKLPMPTGRGAAGGGFGAAYLLGPFSGIASACCAPVLAGVAVLSGASSSFPTALVIGLAYVAGMVAPLAVAGLWWEHHRARATRLLTARTISPRVGPWRRSMPLGTMLSGLLMIGMACCPG
jgi:cytochrome c biogenesis protein CcdA